MRFTPVPLARGIAASLGIVAWAALGRRRRILLHNLEYSAPDSSPRQRRQLARRTFRNIAVIAVDQFRLPSMSPDALKSLFEVRGMEHLESAHRLGKGAIIVTGHLGPYELAAARVAASFPVAGMMENLAPAVLDALATYRAATGMKLVNMKDGIRTAYRLLGEGYMLALVSDRAIGEARSAVEVPFLGGARRLPIGPAVFAQATGAPIITGFTTLNPARRPRYVVEFDPPVFAQGRDESERLRLVRHIARRMETAIREHPDQWFVFQPEWITSDAS